MPFRPIRPAAGPSIGSVQPAGLIVGGHPCPTSGEIAGRTQPTDHLYFLTEFGGGADTQNMACGGPIADGTWYYLADSWRFGCGTRVRITNPANGKSVIAQVADVGPNICVEQAAGRPVIDASPLVTHYLFGRSKGWSDRALVRAEVVDRTTPLGPEGASSAGAILTALALAGMAGIGIWYLERNRARMNPKKDLDREAIERMAPGANRRMARESAQRARHEKALQTPGTEEHRRFQSILANQPEWERLEGQWILQVPGRSVAALPTTGKQNAANFVVFNIDSREEIAFLKRGEVFGWLAREAIRG